MANRTVQILGYGFGSTDATVTVTLSGNVVYNGTVTTSSGPIPPLPDNRLNFDTVPLCTFEIPVDFTGTEPMTCEVTNGTVVFAQITANYTKIPNPVYSSEEWATIFAPETTYSERISIAASHATPPFTSEEMAILESDPPPPRPPLLQEHGVGWYVSSGSDTYLDISASEDARNNVVLDGTAQPVDHEQYGGTYWWKVGQGSTLAYDLNVVATGML